MHSSIGKRLTVAFIGLAIGPLLLVGIVLSWQSFTIQREQALNLQREVAQRVSTQVTAFFGESENDLRLTGQIQDLQKLDQDEQISILSTLLSSQRVFEELILLDNQGQEQARASRLDLVSSQLGDFSEDDAFVIPQTNGETYYSPIRFEETTGEPLITISVPLLDTRTGLIDGVLVSTVRIRSIWNLIANLQVSPGQSVYIVDAQNKVVAHRDPSVVLRGATFDLSGGGAIRPGLTGSSVVLAIEEIRLGQQEFNIVAEQAVSEALALAINTVLITMGLVVTMLAISGTLGLLIVRQIVQPVQSMAATAQAISTGDLSQRVEFTRRDELGLLADTFNDMTAQLQSLIGSLEQRVAERTRGLQAAAEVSRATTSMLEPKELLPQVVNLVRERFDLYYVGLFMIEEGPKSERSFAVLRAGTGKAGEEMMAQGHRLEVGGNSMIGQCTVRAEARIALDVGEEAVHFENPFLPETRSEMALPLRSRGKIIGAMTVQSVEEAAFDEAEIAVMQTMADQVAVAIDNAQLFVETQTALENLEATHQRYLGQAWREYTARQTVSGYEKMEAEIKPTGDEILPEAKQAVAERQPVLMSGDGDHGQSQPEKAPDQSTLVVPIVLRGQPIGALGVKGYEGKKHRWSAEDITLAEEIAEQLALAADNLRLLEETQRRAAREQVAGQVTTRIRETLDMETVLKTAVQEIRQALQLPEVVIRLEAPPDDGSKEGTQ